MKINMQMIDKYVKEYNFIVNRKILPNENLKFEGKLDYRQMKPEEKENNIVVGIELQSNISICDENKVELGKINLCMRGTFIFNKGITEDEMKKRLSINGAAVLYQEMRAFITANTALSSVPNVILPMVNFVEQ